MWSTIVYWVRARALGSFINRCMVHLHDCALPCMVQQVCRLQRQSMLEHLPSPLQGVPRSTPSSAPNWLCGPARGQCANGNGTAGGITGCGAAAFWVWVGHLLAVQLSDAPICGKPVYLSETSLLRNVRPECCNDASRAVSMHSDASQGTRVGRYRSRMTCCDHQVSVTSGLLQVALFRLVGAASQTPALANAAS